MLIVGRTGFVGRHVVRHLIALGHDISLLHHGKTESSRPRWMDDGRPAIVRGEALARWRWARGYVKDIAARAVSSRRSLTL